MFRFHTFALRASMLVGTLALIPFAADAGPAMAAMDHGHCIATGAPEGPLAPWATPHRTVIAAINASAATRLVLGEAANVTLTHSPTVAYAVQPARSGSSVTFGGILKFDVAEPGNYRVALNDRAWIDVVKDGTAAASIAHSHGPECSGVTKMVDYTLEPGSYLLQLGANGDANISALVIKLP